MSDRNNECPECLCRTCKCDERAEEVDVVDEDWLSGVTCNPNAPEECESCQ